MSRAIGALCAMCIVATPALAKDDHEARPDKSAYHVFNPTPRGMMRELSTDRPDTTESPYTVDAGHVQIEISLVDYTYDRTNDADETRHTVGVAPMLVKVGLLNNVDLQLGIDPYTRERVTDRASDTTETTSFFGDVVTRLKINLWGNDGGTTALALMPFVKFPAASDDAGNGNIEGGVILPLGIELPDGFGMGVMAEVDFVRSASDDRYVVDFVHTITVGRDIAGDLAGYVEFAGFANLNADEDYRAYFDAGLTYGLNADTQLDAGVRVGLTEESEDVGVFAGMAWRH